MAGLALLLCMGDSFFLYPLVYAILPGFDRFRAPGRFAFVFSFSVAILSGFGLQALMDGCWHGFEKKRKLLLRIAMGFSAAAVAGALAVSSGMLNGGIVDFMAASGAFGNNAAAIARYVEQTVYPSLTGACWLFALLGVAAGGLAALRLAGRISAPFTAAGAIAIAVLDVLLYGYGYAASPDNPVDLYRKTPLVRELQEQLRTEFFRVNSRDSKPGTTDLGGRHMLFQKNQGSVDRLFLMEGYNPLRLRHEIAERNRHALDILNVKYAIRIDEPSGRMDLALNPTCLPRARMVYNYRVIAADDSICPTLWSDGFNHGTTVILEQKPSVLPCLSCDSVPWRAAITGYQLNAIDMAVETGREGLLVLSEIHYPCWKASVDGRPAPLYRADYALRAIEVGAGKHTVRCYYDDPLFRKGRNLSLLSLCALFGVLGIGWRNTAEKKENPGLNRPHKPPVTASS